ncbi:MAG TPA: maleylpyruvate isomerase family mycothiol-dependent enzyme [Acidimicrobiia bacterium]|nr:maleylpyruvate isomerase family mycothiol-dependent enzyme [Acidimicrobiia bacterium]
MDHGDYISALRWNGNAAAQAARDTSMETMVPSCPEWNLRDLAHHLGSHHRWVAGNLDQPPDGQAYKQREEPPADEGIADWLADGAEMLANKLEATDPAKPCWTWVPFDDTVGFWSRRTTQETAMHRWDAQNTGGDADGVETELAADGVDEYLGILGAFRGRRFPEGGSIHLHTTDTPGEWLVRLDAEGVELTREHAKGDVAIRGPASEVLLVLMGRKTMGAVDVFGEAPLFERFRKHASFG